jgi:hypothetical protein
MRKALILYLVFSASMLGCTSQVHTEQAQTVAIWQKRLQIAEAMFQERCKNVGERIYRTVENVEGIFLLKVRPREINYGDQFALTDPYGRDLGGDGFIESFIRGEYQATHTGTSAPGSPPRTGYYYVEAVDANDGKRYRYTGSIKEVTRTSSMLMGGDGKTVFKTKAFLLDRVSATGQPPRYGVTYDDISSREEREYWIAGSSLKVIDLQNNAVIAERIGYMMDRGQGDTSGGRSPWLLAANHACPTFQRNLLLSLPPGQGAAAQRYQTLDFVEKVLRPTRDN